MHDLKMLQVLQPMLKLVLQPVMRRCVGLLLLLGVPLVLPAQAQQGITFEPRSMSWQQILAKAKAENKYIFVDAYATWCGPCKEMDQKVYTSDSVGAVLNRTFLSVKVQMDSSEQDDALTKQWYDDARALKEKYQVTGFPFFLFFFPDGTLAHKGFGYQEVPEFIRLATFAADPKRKEYAVRLAAYQQGKKDYAVLPELIKTAREVLGDRALAKSMAVDFKHNHVDRLAAEALRTKDIVEFIDAYPDLVTSADPFFRLVYTHPAAIDSIYGMSGWAEYIVQRTVNREDIEPKLYAKDQPITRTPDWAPILATLRQKYNDRLAQSLVLENQIAFYRRIEDWNTWADFKEKQLQQDPPVPGGTAVFSALNMPAWDVFMNCTDDRVLARALAWADRALELDGPKASHQIYDTKASLLYKLGRVAEAIEWEHKAIEVDERQAKERGRAKGMYTEKYRIVIEQMQRGEPIWGAKWKPKAAAGHIPASGALASGSLSKPPVDTSVFELWASARRKPIISNDGHYAAYTIEIGRTLTTLVIKALQTVWRRDLPGVRAGSFTQDSRQVVYLAPHDSLCLLRLGTITTDCIAPVKSFQLVTRGRDELLVYMVTTPARELVVRNLTTGGQQSFTGVTSYVLSNDGTTLLLQTVSPDTTVPAQAALSAVQWVNLPAGTRSTIWRGTGASDLVLDRSNTQLAFTVRGARSAEAAPAIWYYKVGTEKAVLLSTRPLVGPDSGLRLERISRFSRDGRRLFVSLRADASTPKPGAVPVDVWSYTDVVLQSEQLMNVGPKSYAAVLGIADRRVIRLEQDEGEFFFPDATDAYALAERKSWSGIGECHWNAAGCTKSYMVSATDGRRTLLDGFADGDHSGKKFIVVSGKDGGDLYSYEVATGVQRNLTGSLPIPAVDDEHDEPGPKPRGVRPAAWLKNEQALLLYDKYDIWQVDPMGKKPAINLTNGYGRKHNIVFRFAQDYRGKSIDGHETLLVSAFDRTTKDNGFFTIEVGRAKEPVRLTMGPYLYIADGVVNSNFFPLRARDTAVYLVQRQSVERSPNYFWTSDFKTFAPVSDVYPETSYNWLTAELLTVPTVQGRSTQAILYKPENFDPNKKYPVIFYYYDKLSDRLHRYEQPGNGTAWLDTPWFVSHGYVVVTPDIHYTVGEPGQSVYDAVVSTAKYMTQFPWVDSTNMGIHGYSFGGWETGYLVTHTQMFAAAASGAGLYDLVSAYGGLWGDLGAGLAEYYETRNGGIGATLWQRPDLYIKNSPVFDVDKVTTPVFIVHNKEDGNVAFAQGVEWFTAFRRLGKRAWMLQYDGIGHHVGGRANKIDYIIRMTQFFDHYLKGAPPPRWMTRGIPARLKGVDDGLALDDSIATPGPGLLAAPK